jgi:nicotinamidase-related amidase
MTKVINHKKALLVLDLQEVCVGKNHSKLFRYDKQIVKKANEIIASNNIVIYIRTLLKDKFPYKLSPIRIFDGNKNAELTEKLIKRGDIVFDKYRGDAFSNPELLKYLNSNNIDTVEIIGIDGGGCVYLTAMGAINNGLKVIINTKAIDTMLKKRQARLFEVLKEKGATFI